MYLANSNKKQAGIAIVIAVKIEFKVKNIKQEGDRYFIR